MNLNSNTRKMVLSALLGGIIVLLNFTPIGYIQLPIIKATIIHVPVIIGSILLGPKIGAGLGTVFGLTSLYNNTFAPTLLSFAFSPAIAVPGSDRGSWTALLVAFLPRILVGIFPYYVYHFFHKVQKSKREVISLTIAGVAGSMTNTILVMNLIYFLFRDAYGKSLNLAVGAVYKAVLSVIIVNGLPEAILAAILTAGVCKVLKRYVKPTDFI